MHTETLTSTQVLYGSVFQKRNYNNVTFYSCVFQKHNYRVLVSLSLARCVCVCERECNKIKVINLSRYMKFEHIVANESTCISYKFDNGHFQIKVNVTVGL